MTVDHSEARASVDHRNLDQVLTAREFDETTEQQPPEPEAPPEPELSPAGGVVAPDEPRSYHRTDLGNARRLVSQHGVNIRYCHGWRKWLVWNGRVWVLDTDGAIQRKARETVRTIYIEASKRESKSDRADVARWATNSEAAYRLRDMVKLAQDEPGVPIRHELIDSDPMLLFVRNGTLDLRTGKLREHRREDLITKMIDVEYDPDATCPTWDAFLERVVPNSDTKSFIARAMGYSLTGSIVERCLFFLFGIGNNGKSTFVEANMYLMGGYAQKAPASMLMVKRGGGVPNDVARLVGTRLVVASELEQGRRMAEALVKDLTGNDTISARFMRAEWFDFKPTHKLWIYGNRKPEIQGTDDAIWNKIKLIPFTVRIPDDEIDENLPEKLKMEMPGILAWAMRGLTDYLYNGLGTPTQVNRATNQYRAEMDEVARFTEESCHVAPQARCSISELHEAYERWGASLKKRQFGTEVKNHGFTRGRTESSRGWRGIGLLK